MGENILKSAGLIIKNYFFPIITAVIFYLFSFFLHFDNLFFNYPNVYTNNMICIKILHFLFLCFVFCFFSFVQRKIKESDKFFKRGFNLFVIYFLLIFLILLSLWPGTWSWDDIWLLYSDWGYDFNSWYHILTTIFHQVFLQILPFPAGIIIIQNIIISVFISFIIIKLENVYSLSLKNKFADNFLKFMPFFLLPVIRYQLSGNRIGFYIFFELIVLCIILCSLKERKEEKTGYLILFSVLCAIASTWRSESFIYLILGVLFLIFAKYLGNNIKRIVSIIILLSVFCIINYFQSYYINMQHSKDYVLAATVSQAAVLIRSADKQTDRENLEKIDRVLNIQSAIDNPKQDGISLFWEKNFVKWTYSNEDYKGYLSALIQLALKYPKEIFINRWETFYYSIFPAMETEFNYFRFMINIFDTENGLKTTDLFFRNSGFILNNPISKQMRDNVITFISCKSHIKLFSIVWNAFLPLLFIILYFIYMLIKHNWAEIAVLFCILLKQTIIIIAQPVSFFQYNLSIYIIGYIIFFYFIIFLISKIEKNI